MPGRRMSPPQSPPPPPTATTTTTSFGDFSSRLFTRTASSSSSTSSSSSLSRSRGYATGASKENWEQLRDAGHKVNPCNSPLHPAALAGVPLASLDEAVKSIQESYDPHSLCFICGNAHPDGLKLKSFRSEENGRHPSALRSVVKISDNYQGLPGIVSTGILDSLMICHGSWQAGVALMDKAILPRPPLTFTKSFSVQIVDRLPPGTEVEINTETITVEDSREPYVVKVKMELREVMKNDGLRGGDASGAGGGREEGWGGGGGGLESWEGADGGGGVAKATVFAVSEAMYLKVGAVRSMW